MVLPAARGFLRTRMTESPRKNILLINLSLLTGLAFFLPLPVLGISVHISLTPSKTMLQCRSKALTLPRSFLLFRQLIKTCVLLLTDCVRTDKDPVLIFLLASFKLFWSHLRLGFIHNRGRHPGYFRQKVQTFQIFVEFSSRCFGLFPMFFLLILLL